MSREHYKVTFIPSGRVVTAIHGTKLIEAASKAGMSISMPCGGSGTCGKCRVIISQNPSEPLDTEKNFFTYDEIANGWRLACLTVVHSDITVEIPESSRLVGKHKILTDTAEEMSREVLPSVYKKYVELNSPTLEDDKSDLERLCDKIGNFKVNLQILKKLPKLLRKNQFKGTAVISDHTIIDFESDNTETKCYGAAFDIGTTTIVGSLLDLCSGKELAITSRMNPQIAFGDDVLSRINHCSNGDEALLQVHSAINKSVGEMIEMLCSEVGIYAENIYEVSIAGNTTMEHIFCGINPKPLGEVPFISAFSRGLIFDAVDLNMPINPHGRVYIFPVIGGFVGGDTTACVLSSELWKDSGSSLMVDIGTNGEIVLRNGGKLLAASTAAGPALEGARISCGMRAATGAIEKIIFNDDLEISVIGDVEPVGICGSALIDLVAELLRSGVLSLTGQLASPDNLSDDLPAYLKSRIVLGTSGQPEFVIAKQKDGRAISLTQKDIREFQLAVGAIRAGINIMLKNESLKASDLDKILLAGGFGSFIRRDNAQRVGLLPVEIDRQKVCYIGNASLAGSKWALLNSDARKQAETIASETEHVELSLSTDFQMEFAEAMIFPDK